MDKEEAALVHLEGKFITKLHFYRVLLSIMADCLHNQTWKDNVLYQPEEINIRT